MIQVDLSAAEVPVEPGGTAQLTVTITNRAAEDDHIFLEIEGIDVEWYAVPVPSFTIKAGQSQPARVLFRVARNSANIAGTYPFLVRARSMETGDAGVQQAALIVKPFSSLQIELVPKRAVSTFFRHGQLFEVIVTNGGNREETLDLYASDPEDGCAYEFDTDRITLPPGKEHSITLLVEPVTRPIVGSSRLFGFTVTARSVEDAYVSCVAHGQLERRALLSPLTGAVLILLLLGAAGWAIFHPRPVVIRAFTATPAQVNQGEEVRLTWDTANLTDGYISPDNLPLKEPVGSYKVTPDKTTTYTLVARGGGRSETRSVTVIVIPKPPPGKPRIVQFTASRTRVHAGDTVTLSWKVERADKVMLNPLNSMPQDAAMYTSQEVKPDQTTTYILAAQGPGGAVTRSLTVEVVPPDVSIAEIRYFRAKPDTILAGEKATISWSVANASSIEIDNGVGGGQPPRGKFDVWPQQTTVYTLRAMDDKGNLRTAQVTVTVKPAPPTQPQPTETPEGVPNTPPPTGGPPPHP